MVHITPWKAEMRVFCALHLIRFVYTNTPLMEGKRHRKLAF